MLFRKYNKIKDLLCENVLQQTLQKTLREDLVNQVLDILQKNPTSPLSQYIIKRIENPKTPVQKFETNKLDTVSAYNLDPIVYEELKNVTSTDVGPGEVVIALVGGTWTGGHNGNYDVILPKYGKVEIKYLGPIAHSTNVPTGSSNAKTLEKSEFFAFIHQLGQFIKSDPRVLKGLLSPEDLHDFLQTGLDELVDTSKSLSTRNLRSVGKILRNGKAIFSKQKFSFEAFKKYMEDALLTAVGDCQYILFLGEKTEQDGTVKPGQYFLMPKSSLKYWMFYRTYDGNRVKIAPFSTEAEFFK